jgi:uncharacterized protein (DUF1778 family)
MTSEAESNVTVLPADVYDALVASLDDPHVPCPALEAAARQNRDILTRERS